jgi:uncharacterized membrane protein YfcA
MKPTKTTIALIAFTIVEAWVLSRLVATGFKAAKIGPIFPNDLVFNLVVLLIGGVIGYFIGKLVIQKLRARAWIKAIIALVIIGVSMFVSSYITLIYYRLIVEGYIRNYHN